MDSSDSSNRWDNLIELNLNQLIQVAILGAVVGVVVWLLSMFLGQLVLTPIMCGEGGNDCGATNVGGAIASILAGLVGLMGLVRLSVFRPLLIVIAAVISLWGLSNWVSGLAWFEALSWSVLLYGFAYAAFAWLVRPRPFVAVIITLLLVVFLVRLLASA